MSNSGAVVSDLKSLMVESLEVLIRSPEAMELILRTRRDLDEICRLGGLSETVVIDMVIRSPFSLETILQNFRDLDKLSNE